ncbi:MAG: CDP-diacylglycerol--glycerol-3-phosphate 3-phosphatidyltransferase [Gemmatimonadetes bacterium]|nr:MAG: CDP-diacylglycerol--glycerol-3-phosphate 3-phosphatidyltransferase [Gemmatimonadota bacterium]
MASRRLNLPNLITITRIAVCPVIFLLALSLSVPAQFAAFVLFVAAGLSDLWDGYLARKHGLITDMGKLLDPLADKLLLASTFIPFYIVSHRPGGEWALPFWGPLPLWVVLVIFGREVAVTLLRQWAARRDVIIAAGPWGKYKAFLQNLFSGGLLLWYPLQRAAVDGQWTHPLWRAFSAFHATWIGLTLLLALVLTVYSMVDYFWSYRALMGVRD